jgi:hypothetical protein
MVLDPQGPRLAMAYDASWCSHIVEFHLWYAGICSNAPVGDWQYNMGQDSEPA